MKVKSKFDSTDIGEVEDIKLSDIKTFQAADSRMNPAKLLEAMASVLDKFYRSEENVTILALETGRAKHPCKEELLKTIDLIKYPYGLKMIEAFGTSPVRIEYFRKVSGIATDSSLPIFTMFKGILESILQKRKPMILHNPLCPISTMTLSNDLYETLRETGDYIFDIVQEAPIKAFDQWAEGEKVLIWGNTHNFVDIQRKVDRNNVIWNRMENGVTVIPDRAHLDMAGNAVSGLSYLSVSNRFLMSQVFLVADKEYVFFKNRLIEYLKRDVKTGYGVEGDINYFNHPDDATATREAVRRLLENGFDYVEGLHESVHLLENRYGENVVPMDQITGPVVVLYHFKNIKEAIDKAAAVKNCQFINIFTDSCNTLEYVRNRNSTETMRNLERSSSLLL